MTKNVASSPKCDNLVALGICDFLAKPVEVRDNSLLRVIATKPTDAGISFAEDSVVIQNTGNGVRNV